MLPGALPASELPPALPLRGTLPVQAGRVGVRRDRGRVAVNPAGEPVELPVDDQNPHGGDDGGGGSDDGGNGGELFDHGPDGITGARP